ncbi:MAG: polysaccharide deacetylase family protein [Candidatus Tritonobacter lacicola]|nr:polysaccharide deacetylase family protein [Candidatus Tritonobacter lacicola]
MSGASFKVRLVFSCSREMEWKAEYVLSTFLDVIGIPVAPEGGDPRRCITIRYGAMPAGGAEEEGIFIRASSEASRFFSSRLPLDTRGVRRVSIGSFKDVPDLFPPASGPAEEGKNILAHDIVASAFYFLSNREEVGDDRRDAHGRYLYSQSTSAKLGLEGCPVVDTYISILKEMIHALCVRRGVEFSTRPAWPGSKKFALCLTHDVDCVRRYSLCSFRQKFPGLNSFFLRHPLTWDMLYSAQRLFNPAVDRIDPFWAFSDIMAMEKSYGFSSSFYFQAGGTSPYDTVCYRADDGDIRAVMEAIREAGFEVGLHGSYNSGLREGLMKEEAEKLTSLAGELTGHRQHFLRMDPHRSFGIYSRAGMRYDATLGYVDREGYRNGLSFPFNPYDAEEDRPFGILEIPLTVMEWTLTHYRNLSPSDAWPALRALLEMGREHGGCVCLLWHVHMFYSAPLRDLYRKALEWAAEHNGWGTTAGSIYEWWIERRRRYGLDSNLL